MTDDDIISGILEREGGAYTNLPADRGGPTRWGITLADLGPGATAADVQALTADQARAIYRTRYVHAPGFDIITNDALRALVVDTGVLHGTGTAARWLQLALSVAPDGVLGLETVGALSAKPLLGTFLSVLGMRIHAEVGRVYIDASQLQFLRGWMNRSLSFLTATP